MLNVFSKQFINNIRPHQRAMKLLWVGLIMSVFLSLSGCQAIPPKPYHNDYVIQRYTSSPWGFSTNSFWVEGPEGVVLIDTQFIPSATLEAVEMAESYTGKKVVLAIVLHANPDKFNGTKVLTERGIRVVTSSAVRDLIPGVDKKRREWFYDRYAPDYPSTLVLPEGIDKETTTLNAAGLLFRLHHLGPAVSMAHLVVEFDGHLFVGDLIANHNHAWMELGLSKEWIALLEQLQSLQPRAIHPGRGNSSGAALVQSQIDYLRFVRQTIAQYKTQPELTPKIKDKIITTIENRYPRYGNDYFLNLGIPAEYQAQ